MISGRRMKTMESQSSLSHHSDDVKTFFLHPWQNTFTNAPTADPAGLPSSDPHHSFQLPTPPACHPRSPMLNFNSFSTSDAFLKQQETFISAAATEGVSYPLQQPISYGLPSSRREGTSYYHGFSPFHVISVPHGQSGNPRPREMFLPTCGTSHELPQAPRALSAISGGITPDIRSSSSHLFDLRGGSGSQLSEMSSSSTFSYNSYVPYCKTDYSGYLPFPATTPSSEANQYTAYEQHQSSDIRPSSLMVAKLPPLSRPA